MSDINEKLASRVLSKSPKVERKIKVWSFTCKKYQHKPLNISPESKNSLIHDKNVVSRNFKILIILKLQKLSHSLPSGTVSSSELKPPHNPKEKL